MTPALLASISQAEDKTRLEDLYLPFKKKRRTKAQIALEAGLEPLADALLANPDAATRGRGRQIPEARFHYRSGRQSRCGRCQGSA